MFQFVYFYGATAKSDEAVINLLRLSGCEVYSADLQIYRLSSTSKVQQDPSTFATLVFNPYKDRNI